MSTLLIDYNNVSLIVDSEARDTYLPSITPAHPGATGPRGAYAIGVWTPGIYPRDTIASYGNNVWLSLRTTSVAPSSAAPDDWALWIDGSTALAAGAAAVQAAASTADDLVHTTQDRLATAADVIAIHGATTATAADRVQTGLDRAQTTADRVQTGQDRSAVATDKATINAILTDVRRVYLGGFASDPTADGNGNPLANGATYENTTTNKIRIYEDGAWHDYDATAQTLTNAASVSAAAAAGSASAAQTDRQLADADVLLTHADVVLTHADVALTHADVVLTGADRTATHNDKVAADADAAATAADRIQTGLDRVATAADRVQTGLDRTAASTSASTASTASGTAQGFRDTAQTLKDSTSTAALQAQGYMNSAAASAASAQAVAQTNLNAAARAVILSASVLSVFIYDTTKDTDGGSWRSKVGHTSWMNEPLNTVGSNNISRGVRQDFPSKALLVAQTNSFSIYDLDDPTCPLWRSFSNVSGPNPLTYGALSAINGFVLVSQGTNGGFWAYDFITDKVGLYYGPGSTVNTGDRVGNIVNPGVATAGGASILGGQIGFLAHGSINDLAATILPNTPLNPLRANLPNPTVAAATDAGMSVIWPDGVVANVVVTRDGVTSVKGVRWTKEGNILHSHSTGVSTNQRLYCYVPPRVNTASPLVIWNSGGIGTDPINYAQTPSGPAAGAAAICGRNIAKSMNGSAGCILLNPDNGSAANSMFANFTDKFNSGYQPGPIKMALAESSADLSTLAGVTYGPELVTNGNFTGVQGWYVPTGVGSASLLSFANNELTLTAKGGTNGRAEQVIAGLVIGKTYSISVTMRRGTTPFGIGWFVNSSSNLTGSSVAFVPYTSSATNVTNTLLFTATQTTHYLTFDMSNAPADGSTAIYSNVSCKEVLGEITLNGDFTNGITSWSQIGTGGTYNTSTPGEVAITGGTSPGLRQNYTLTVGKTYQVSITMRRTAGGGSPYGALGSTNVNWGTITNGVSTTATALLTATVAGNGIDIGVSGDASASTVVFENVSLKEVSPELVTNGTFTTDTSGWAVGPAASGLAVVAGELQATCANAAGVATTTDAITVTAGKQYAFSATHRNGTAGGSRVQIVDFNTGTVLLQYDNVSTSNVTVSGVFSGPANGQVYVRQFFVGASAAGQTIYMDNVSIKAIFGELVQNGTFDNGTTGWTPTGTATVSVSGGRLQVQINAANENAYQAIPVVAGRTYQVTVDNTTSSLGSAYGVTNGTVPGGASLIPLDGATGVRTATFTAQSSSAVILLRLSSAGTGTVPFDNVSVKEVPAELVVNGTFSAPPAGWVASGNATITMPTSGKIRVTSTGTAWPMAVQTPTGLTIGATYLMTVAVAAKSAGASPAFGINGGGGVNNAPLTTQTMVFTATATNPSPFVGMNGVNANGEWVEFTLSSVKQITQGELVTNGTFDNGTTGWTAQSGGTVSASNRVLTMTSALAGAQRFSQPITCVVGQTYKVTGTAYWGTSISDLQILVSTNSSLNAAIVGTPVIRSATPTTGSAYFVATATTMYVGGNDSAATIGGTTFWKDISVRPVAADRSVAANHPLVYGNVTRTPVATGAEMAGYGGFSGTGNCYLEYSGTAFDPGTGDFAFMAWAIPTATGYMCLLSYGNGAATTSSTVLRVNATSDLTFGNLAGASINAGKYTLNTPVFAVGVRRGANLELYVNGAKVGTVAGSVIGTLPNATLRVGHSGNFGFPAGQDPFFGVIALPRVAIGFAPTPDQIKAMYEAERPLFDANAKCLLAGSPTVQSLAYDEDSDKLFAATPVGTNVFKGLKRVAYLQSTTAVNRLPNSDMLGAANGTPPTNWNFQTTLQGVSVACVGRGVESGMPYIDVSVTGTSGLATAISIDPVPNAITVPAANGQTWTIGVGFKLISGNPTVGSGFNRIGLALVGRTSGAAAVGSIISPSDIRSSVTATGIYRATLTYTLADPTAVFIQPRIQFGFNNAEVQNYVLRIYEPTLVQAASDPGPLSSLSNNDNHKFIAAAANMNVIGTANGVDLTVPAIPLRERLDARRQLPPYDPTWGQYTGVTTDATPTVLAAVAIPEGKCFTFRATVGAAQYGGVATEKARYDVTGTVTRDLGGSVVVLFTTNTINEVTATMDCVAQANTTAQTLEIKCTGKAATRMAWSIQIELYDIGLMVAA